MVLRDAVFWPFLAGWSAVTAGFGWQRWRPGLVLAAVVLAGWIVTLGYTVSDDHPHEIVVTLGLMLAGASLFGLRAFPDHRRDLATGVGFGLAIAFCGLFAIQFFETRTVIELIAAAAMTLLLTLGAVAWGWRNGNRGLTWAGYGGFSVEILALYFETVGSLLGSSLFFLAAGALVTVLAWVAYRLGRAEPNPDPEEETAP
jgi:MFS family permease